jgi:hypothetical protein
MGKKKPAASVAETEALPDVGKYRIRHSQEGETVEVSFHDAERRDSHAAHLRSTGVQNIETIDADEETPAEE